MWGYGGAPRVSNSHSSTPKDHCGKKEGNGFSIYPQVYGKWAFFIFYFQETSAEGEMCRAHASVPVSSNTWAYAELGLGRVSA